MIAGMQVGLFFQRAQAVRKFLAAAVKVAENSFASTRHATIFESVKVAPDDGGTIQKMVSAPILLDGRVIGVIQVSRKGANPHSAGPDFTSQDLGNILALCKPLGKMLRHIAGE